MKSILNITCLLFAATGILAADVPRKPLPSKYRSLWTQSPFTVKPEVIRGTPYNALQDYVVMGIGPTEDGHRVTLLNSKRPNDGRFIIKTGKSNSKGIVIDEVIEQEDRLLSDGTLTTKVKIKDSSGNEATVGFDRKFLAIKAPAPAAASRPPQVRGRTTNQGSRQGSQGQAREPRKRIIPPGLQNKNTSSNRGAQGSPSRRIVPSNRGNSGR